MSTPERQLAATGDSHHAPSPFLLPLRRFAWLCSFCGPAMLQYTGLCTYVGQIRSAACCLCMCDVVSPKLSPQEVLATDDEDEGWDKEDRAHGAQRGFARIVPAVAFIRVCSPQLRRNRAAG